MTADWKNIHQDFTVELQKDWENKGFDCEETKKWVDIGLKPIEYELANFIKNRLGYNSENIPRTNDNSNIETFRQIYEKNLEQNQEGQFEDFQIQEAINQSLLSLDGEERTDRGWLTDDNIEYILKNDEITSQTEEIQIRTDLANIYLQMEKAKRGEVIDEDFWNSLNTKKKYVIFPLRISGNHWSLLLFVNSKNNERVNWVYYISSLGQQAVEEEIIEVGGFLKQISKKFGTTNNSIINENNLSEIVFRENPRQPNTWDCGVYLCKFIQFLCLNEYYNLNETNCQISEPEVREFRAKWRNKIGEEKWCKWDVNISVNKEENEEEQLQKAITQSLLFSQEETRLQETILLSSQQSVLASKEIQEDEKLVRENHSLKAEIETLKEKIKFLENQAFYQQVEIDNLNHKNAELEKEKNSSESFTQICQELEQEKAKNQELVRQLEEFKKVKNQNELQTKKEKLKELVEKLGARIGEADDLDELLESQEEIVRNSDNSYAQKQLKKHKTKLLKKLTEEAVVEEICQLKAEIVELEIQLENLTEQAEAKILIPESRNNYK